jgi:hypothetical protein
MIGRIGPRGLSVLIFFAIVGLALAIVGWFQRNGALVGPLPNDSSLITAHLVVRGITG